MSGWRLLAWLSVAMIFGEAAVIAVSNRLPIDNPTLRSAVAVVALVACAYPILRIFVFDALRARMRQLAAAQRELIAAREALRGQIAQRSAEVVATHRALEDTVQQLDVALNNMRQGLCMYDGDVRLVLCNDRYREMYGLPADIIKPGCSFYDVVEQQRAAGNVHSDADHYVPQLLARLAEGRVIEDRVTLNDGRIIRIVQQPIAGGRWVATHEDITAQCKAEEELANTRNFLNTVIEHVPATILVKDANDFRYVLLNQAGVEFFGLAREQIIGRSAYAFFPKEVADSIQARDEELLRDGTQNFYDDHSIHATGLGVRSVTTKRLVIRGADGEPKYLLGVIEDITERKRAEAQIAHMAHHDALTGLPNRAAFNERLNAALVQAKADAGAVALLCIDLDRFKEINDVYGHSAGDALLQEVSRRLQGAAEGAFTARLGGDEFTVILADGPQPASAEALADRLLKAAADDLDVAGNLVRTGLSIGVAIFPTDGEDAASLLNNADAALYRAKADGRGAIRFFDAEMDSRLRERRAMQQELHSAIPNRELLLHYQPLAQLGGDIVGFEALVRWQHPARGMVPPASFIPLAEESSLIITIGEWILREACREAASWLRPLHVAVNLSPIQFRHGDLARLVHSILLETGLSPGRLELEITEGVLIGDFSRALAILGRLKALGVKIAMDDFGTGYSSLSYLQSFPFDKIKIDQAFISNVDRNSQSASIVRAVIGLGRGLHVPVAAEGVETAEQLAFLRSEDCDQVQGYLLGRPRPISDYAELVGHKVAVRIEAAG